MMGDQVELMERVKDIFIYTWHDTEKDGIRKRKAVAANAV